jgi:hypothetical protein
VQLEEPVDRFRTDRPSLAAQHRRQPERLPGSFLGLDVDVATTRIGDHEPHQPGPDDEPDDEQPPIELGVHRVRV